MVERLSHRCDACGQPADHDATRCARCGADLAEHGIFELDTSGTPTPVARWAGLTILTLFLLSMATLFAWVVAGFFNPGP